MTEPELIKYFEDMGYQNVRALDEGVIGTIDMLFTRALVIDLTHGGYGHRYCYQNRNLATKACQELKNLDDKPLPGYSAVKGLALPD